MTIDSLTARHVPEVFRRIPIQTGVSDQLSDHLYQINNSYLFLGPDGSGKHEWSLAFAAAIMCRNGGCAECAICKSVLHSRHQDLNFIENRSGVMPIDVARELVKAARLTPNVARYRVVIINKFDNAREVAPVLLKTIEEPPASTVFLILVDGITPEFKTIASRCVRVDFMPLQLGEIEHYLRHLGVPDDDAKLGARFCDGDLKKANELAFDGKMSERIALWSSLCGEKYNSGHQIMTRVMQIVEFLDLVLSEFKVQQQIEVQTLRENAKGSSGTKVLIKELELEQARTLRYRRRRELTLGFGIYLSIVKETTVAGTSGLDDFVEQCALVQESMFKLNAGVSEQIVLGTLLGALG